MPTCFGLNSMGKNRIRLWNLKLNLIISCVIISYEWTVVDKGSYVLILSQDRQTVIAWYCVWTVGVVVLHMRENFYKGKWTFLRGFSEWTHILGPETYLRKKNKLFKLSLPSIYNFKLTPLTFLSSSSLIQNAEPEYIADLYPLRVKLVQPFSRETYRFWTSSVLWSHSVCSGQKSGSLSLWHLLSAGYGSAGCLWQHTWNAHLQDGILTAR